MKPVASPVGTEYKPTKLPMGVSGGNGGGSPPSANIRVTSGSDNRVTSSGDTRVTV